MEDTSNHSIKPVVAYYRLSVEKENGRELGIQAQQQIVHHYFKGRITKEYKEIKSGKNITNRPVLQQAIDYCVQNDYVLAVARLDRLSRSVDDCRNILQSLGNNLRSCDIPGEIDKFTLTMFGAFAERERELIGLRTSQALQAKLKKEGKWQRPNPDFVSGKIGALGRATNTRLSKQNAHNRRAAGVICLKVKEGNNFVEITNFLNGNGFCAPKGGKFTPCQVSRIYRRFCA